MADRMEAHKQNTQKINIVRSTTQQEQQTCFPKCNCTETVADEVPWRLLSGKT